MPISGYDKEAVMDYLREAFEHAPRGAAAEIARDAGITESSVSRYRRGRDCPSPEKWPIIERHLGLKPGAIARAGGLPPKAVARASALMELEKVIAEQVALSERVAELQRLLHGARPEARRS